MVKHALVTGGTGYIGPKLIDCLLQNGYKITALVRNGSPAKFDSNVDVIEDDGSTNHLIKNIGSIGLTHCFHLATYFVPTHRAEDIDPLIESNLLFSTRLAQACATIENISFINIGTLWQHVDGSEYKPASLYSATKQAFLDILKYYNDVEKMSVVHLDLSDTYGPDDPRPKLLNLLIKSFQTGEALEMSAGEQLIDPVYVDDAVSAIAMAGDLGSDVRQVQHFAVSSDEPVTVKQYVAILEEILGGPLPIKWGAKQYRPREMFTSWVWADRLSNWSPKVSLEEGLKRVVNAMDTTHWSDSGKS